MKKEEIEYLYTLFYMLRDKVHDMNRKLFRIEADLYELKEEIKNEIQKHS